MPDRCDGTSLAVWLDLCDEEDKELEEFISNSLCEYSGHHSKNQCDVISQNARLDVCKTCGYKWHY